MIRLPALLGIALVAGFATVTAPASAQNTPERQRTLTVESRTGGAAQPTDPAERPRRSPALFTTGLGLAIAGALVKNAIGGYLLISEMSFTKEHDETKIKAGYACLIGGALMIAVGIPMAVIGGRKEAPRAVLVPMFGPEHAGAGMSLRF